MIVRLDAWSKVIARSAAVVVVAAGASACSSVPSWVDPTTWIGGDESSSNQTPAETTAENSPTPDITNVPDKPAPASTADEQKQVADSLQSDKSRAEYSGDQLRGGTEASAPPPPDTPPPEVADTSASSPSTTPATPSDDKSASLAQAPSSAPDQPAAPAPASTPPPPPTPQATASNSSAVPAVSPSAATSASAPAPAAAAPEAPPPTKMALAEPPPAATPSGDRLPAVPANSGAIAVGGPAMASTDTALGFQRSNAPPLDASVGQFVPQQILSRYQETAEVSGTAGVQPGGTRFTAQAATPAMKSDTDVASAAPAKRAKGGMGGPEQMSGAVVANFESIDPPVAAPGVSANPAGLPTSSVVYFPHDTTILGTGAKGQIRTAVQAYLSNGGQGYIRVVGHASSGGNMPLQRRMIWNFERSQARAKAVAQELIRDGIPADKVLVEAVGDSEPNYDPSQGDESNRRAEIFFQT